MGVFLSTAVDLFFLTRGYGAACMEVQVDLEPLEPLKSETIG